MGEASFSVGDPDPSLDAFPREILLGPLALTIPHAIVRVLCIVFDSQAVLQ